MHSALATFLLHMLLTGVSVLIVGKLMPGITVKSYGSAVLFAFVVGIFNAIAWGFLLPLSAGFTILTLGIGYFIINGLVFLGASKVIGGVQISGCLTAIFASIGVSFVNWAMHALLGGWFPR